MDWGSKYRQYVNYPRSQLMSMAINEAVSKIVTNGCASLGYKLTMTPAEHPW